MPRFHNINGVKVQFTAAEETEWENMITKSKEKKQIKLNEATAIENKKASGKQKLKDLGLDDDEIKALIGA